MNQLPTKTATQAATVNPIETAPQTKQTRTIEIALAKIEVPITSNKPDLYESNRQNLKLTRAQTCTIYGILYGLQMSGEKMEDGSAPRLPVDAVRWMLDKIGKQFELENEI